MAGLGVLVTCATLGCGWLIYKTEGELQQRMRALIRARSALRARPGRPPLLGAA